MFAKMFDIMVAAKGNASFFKQAVQGIFGLLLAQLYLRQGDSGCQRKAHAAPRIGRSFVGKKLYNFIVF